MLLHKTLVWFCLLCTTAFAGINVQDVYDPYEPIEITCEVESGENTQVIYEWNLPDGLKTKALNGNQKLYGWAGPGTYDVECTTVVQYMAEVETIIRDKDDPTNPAKFKYEIVSFVVKIDVQKYNESFTVGDPCINPDPDPKPEPDPKPDPVDPDPPVVVDDPIAATGFHVLILEETGERPRLPKDQRFILQSSKVRSVVTQKYQGHFRVADPDSPLNFENERWVDAIQRPRTKLPWIIVSNDQTWYEGPLPSNLNDTLALLEKHKPR